MIEKMAEITDDMWSLVNSENRKMVQEFLDQSLQLSPQTLKQYESALKIYFYWIFENCENKLFYIIKGKDYLFYQNYLSKKGLSSSAIKLKRSAVSSFNGYVELYYSEEYKDFRNYVGKKISSPPPSFVNKKEPLTMDEYNRLCEELEKRELFQQLAYLKFSFSTGCRREEVRQLLKIVVNESPITRNAEVIDENKNKKVVEVKTYLSHPIRCKGKGVIGKIRKLQFDQFAI